MCKTAWNIHSNLDRKNLIYVFKERSYEYLFENRKR